MEGWKKGLIISSDTQFYEKYMDIGGMHVEIFYAPSLEVADLLSNVHKFDFAIMNNIMMGRIPGIDPNVAVFRDDAGSEYGSKILSKKKIPYVIIGGERSTSDVLPEGCIYQNSDGIGVVTLDFVLTKAKIFDW